MCSTVLFFVREINRFLETLSSFCIFEKALFLDPRDLRLDTRDSILERFEHRGSRIESQVRVSSVNLLLSSTVNTFQNGKSPGDDGYTAEFYNHFFSLLGQDLVSSFNAAFDIGEMSVSQ